MVLFVLHISSILDYLIAVYVDSRRGFFGRVVGDGKECNLYCQRLRVQLYLLFCVAIITG